MQIYSISYLLVEIQLPQTADEYLAAGVKEEEGGEKWRAGDATKSLRFFHRAIDFYTEGERKFPSSFDLIYNVARVQYAVTQYPTLMRAATIPTIEYLKSASEAGKRAMRLDPNNIDNLFNLGQCLTSIGDELYQTQVQQLHATATVNDCAQIIGEGMETLQKCCLLQERALEQQPSTDVDMNTEIDTAMDDVGTDDNGMEDWSQQIEEKWVMTQDPVTVSSLCDTMFAQIAALTSLCEMRYPKESRSFESVEFMAGNIANKLLIRVDTPEEKEEAEKALMILKLALTDAQYKERAKMSIESYNEIVQTELTRSASILTSSSEALCAKADILHAHANAIRIELLERNGTGKYTTLMWKQLSFAIQSWAEAAKRGDSTTSNVDIAKLHLAQGDCELMRFGMAQPPISFQAAIASATVLLKNAMTYYTGAERVARASSSSNEVQEAMVKQALVTVFQEGGNTKLIQWFSHTRTKVVAEGVLKDAIDDGLLNPDLPWVSGLLNIEAAVDAKMDFSLF